MTARFYAMTLTRGGARVPVKVWFGRPVDPITGELLERPATWRCQIDGQDDAIEACMIEIDGVTNEPVIKGETIDEDEYTYLLQRNTWAREHEPESPHANPRKRIDMNALEPIKWNP